MPLLVVGSVAYDTILTPVEERKDVLGGSGIHFTAASSFFTLTRVVGVVGKDFDMNHLSFLRDRNTDLSGIYIETGNTFRWTGKYHENMNERDTLSTELNVFEHFKPRIPDAFQDSKYVFLANINPDLQLEVLKQIDDPVFTALDTMNFWIEGSRPALEKVLAKVECIILNDSEARDFSGEFNLSRAAKAVAQMGPKIIIIKKGEHGALMYHNGTFFSVPAFILDSVADPTGAGDSFAGGFMGYLSQQGNFESSTLRTAVVYGTCMASFCCEDFGSYRFMSLTPAEIEKRFIEFQKMIAIS